MSDVMHNFELYQPGSVADALDLLDEHGKEAWIIAGGKDSLDWFKDRVKTPPVLVDVSAIEELHGIREETDGGLWIGAMTTLTEIAESDAVRSRFPALSDAAGRVASPQIRNAGTFGGNLSQDTRCFYYRDGFPCYRADGNTCYANTPTAMNREHALFEASRCVAVTASDTAPVTVALDAEMVIRNGSGERTVKAEDFFVGPEIDITRMTVIQPGDILLGVRIPGTWAGAPQYFEKVADREVWDFALVNIAMAAKTDGGKITGVRMACGGVQCTPRRLTDVEDLVTGEEAGEELETLVQRVAASGAKPLNYNHFKVSLLENLAKRAVRSLA